MTRPLTAYNKELVREAEKRRERIKRLMARGMSYASIGRQLDLSRQRVRQIATGTK